MTALQTRAVIYGVIAGGQTLMLGIKDGTMTAADWIRLAISSVVAVAIAVRALYDCAPDATRTTNPPPDAQSSANNMSAAACADSTKADGGGLK